MPKTTSKSTKTYQQLSEELATIIDWFESGEAQVDEAIAKYEKALELIAQIEKYLAEAGNRLRKVNAKLG